MPEGRTGRSLAYCSLIGGLIALVLDCLAWTVWALTWQAMLRHLPHPATTSSDLNLMLAQVRAQHHALLLLPRALWTIVFVAECAISFWIGPGRTRMVLGPLARRSQANAYGCNTGRIRGRRSLWSGAHAQEQP